MSRRIAMVLAISSALAGCSSMLHGPVARVISNNTRTEQVQWNGAGGVNRVLVTESRLSDEKGREWTERAIVGIEPVPGGMDHVKAELFAEAQTKSQQLLP